MSGYILKAERLGLRQWKVSDYVPFAKMCADPEVMRYFPTTLSTEESNTLIDSFKQRFEQYGFTYYAVDILTTKEQSAQFIGFAGLLPQTYKSAFTPNVDIGWRLKKSVWGKGYATEAAKACLE